MNLPKVSVRSVPFPLSFSRDIARRVSGMEGNGEEERMGVFFSFPFFFSFLPPLSAAFERKGVEEGKAPLSFLLLFQRERNKNMSLFLFFFFLFPWSRWFAKVGRKEEIHFLFSSPFFLFLARLDRHLICDRWRGTQRRQPSFFPFPLSCLLRD